MNRGGIPHVLDNKGMLLVFQRAGVPEAILVVGYPVGAFHPTLGNIVQDEVDYNLASNIRGRVGSIDPYRGTFVLSKPTPILALVVATYR